MAKKEKVERYYKVRARELVDFLYDKGFLAEDLSRGSMRWLEDYLGFVSQSDCRRVVRAALLTKSIRERAAQKVVEAVKGAVEKPKQTPKGG